MFIDFVLMVCGIVLYIGPVAILPIIVRRIPAARRVIAVALLVAPAIGASIYLSLNRKFSIEGLVFAYPLAMFPLGFWSALIAALTTPLMLFVRDKYGRSTLIVVAGLSGALIGPTFMFGFVHLAAVIQQPLSVNLPFFLLCGLTAGTTVGLLAGFVIGATFGSGTSSTKER